MFCELIPTLRFRVFFYLALRDIWGEVACIGVTIGSMILGLLLKAKG